MKLKFGMQLTAKDLIHVRNDHGNSVMRSLSVLGMHLTVNSVRIYCALIQRDYALEELYK